MRHQLTGPAQDVVNRFVRWSRMGVFQAMFEGLAGDTDTPTQGMGDATSLKAHRTASSLKKGAAAPAVSAEPKAD